MIRVEEGEGTATFSISKERSFVTGAPNISASPTRSERFSWKKKKKKGTGRKTRARWGAGLKVWGSSLVESWNRCRAWNRMLERTGRRGVIRWKETRDRRRRCTLLGDYRRSIARWISNESLKFRWNITVQLYLNPLDSNSYFRSSPWTLGRAQVPRIFDTLVQKSNANWIFAERDRARERKEGEIRV